MYTHINWGGLYRLEIIGETLHVYVHRWGKHLYGVPMKRIWGDAHVVFSADDIDYFIKVS